MKKQLSPQEQFVGDFINTLGDQRRQDIHAAIRASDTNDLSTIMRTVLTSEELAGFNRYYDLVGSEYDISSPSP